VGSQARLPTTQSFHLTSSGDTLNGRGRKDSMRDRLQVDPLFTVTANGYRDQLDRVWRFLERVEAPGPRSDVYYQDDVWAFFQNCWHLKDWLLNDPRMSPTVRAQIKVAVGESSCLMICSDITNGTKHYLLQDPRVGARHSHTDSRIAPGEETIVDCFIELQDGTRLSARKIARECLAEWERILKQLNLPTDRLS